MVAGASPLSHTKFLGKLIRTPLKLIPHQKVLRIRRGLAKDFKWVAGSSIHGCWLGTYEWEKQQAIKQFIRPGMTVFDIGANAGFYTLIFSRLVGQAGAVVAVEPFASNICSLLSHVSINGLSNVRVAQVALEKSSGVAGFTVDRNRSMNHIMAPSESQLLVPTLSLDDLVTSLGTQTIDLIKIDVEGAEAAVLAGGHKTIAQHKPVIFLALHGEKQMRECKQFLTGVEYDLFGLDGKPLANKSNLDEVIAKPRPKG